MRTTETMTVSLPPEMVREFEKVRKAERRTRSELVREALRTYFTGRGYTATPAELRAIEKGEGEIRQGKYMTLNAYLAKPKLGGATQPKRSKGARPRAQARS